MENYPVTIIQYASISSSEVYTQPTSPCAEEKNPVIAVHIIEFLNLYQNRSINSELMY